MLNCKKRLKHFVDHVINSMPVGVEPRSVDVWLQAEARIGQHNTVMRVWAKTGTRARVVRQRQCLSAYVLSASCAALEQSAAMVMPKSDTAAMQEYLSCISATVQLGRHAVIVMDRAAWHTTKQLPGFKDLTLILLPPAAFELNPMDQGLVG